MSSDTEKTIEDYDKEIENNPNEAELYYKRGVAKNEISDFRGAFKDFDKAIEINPEKSSYYFYRGGLKDQLKDYRGAIEDFNKAIELYPESENYYDFRGSIKLFEINDYHGAIEDFNKAIELNPENAFYYQCLSVAKYQTSNYQGAFEDITKAIELDPTDLDSFALREQINEFINLRNKEETPEDTEKTKKPLKENSKKRERHFMGKFLIDDNELERQRQEQIEKAEKSYQHVPKEYRVLCYEDDKIVQIYSNNPFKDAIRSIRSYFVSDTNVLGRIAQKSTESSYSVRMSKYRDIISDIKLDVSPNYWKIFETEAEKLLSEMKSDTPSSWVPYSKVIMWCMKFSNNYPKEEFNKEQTNNPEKEKLENKFEEREKFQEERLRKYK